MYFCPPFINCYIFLIYIFFLNSFKNLSQFIFPICDRNLKYRIVSLFYKWYNIKQKSNICS
nr:MAG TPA: hypothetical protein [Caudoviricetes sp.]